MIGNIFEDEYENGTGDCFEIYGRCYCEKSETTPECSSPIKQNPLRLMPIMSKPPKITFSEIPQRLEENLEAPHKFPCTEIYDLRPTNFYCSSTYNLKKLNQDKLTANESRTERWKLEPKCRYKEATEATDQLYGYSAQFYGQDDRNILHSTDTLSGYCTSQSRYQDLSNAQQSSTWEGKYFDQIQFEKIRLAEDNIPQHEFCDKNSLATEYGESECDKCLRRHAQRNKPNLLRGLLVKEDKRISEELFPESYESSSSEYRTSLNSTNEELYSSLSPVPHTTCVTPCGKLPSPSQISVPEYAIAERKIKLSHWSRSSIPHADYLGPCSSESPSLQTPEVIEISGVPHPTLYQEYIPSCSKDRSKILPIKGAERERNKRMIEGRCLCGIHDIRNEILRPCDGDCFCGPFAMCMEPHLEQLCPCKEHCKYRNSRLNPKAQIEGLENSFKCQDLNLSNSQTDFQTSLLQNRRIIGHQIGEGASDLREVLNKIESQNRNLASRVPFQEPNIYGNEYCTEGEQLNEAPNDFLTKPKKSSFQCHNKEKYLTNIQVAGGLTSTEYETQNAELRQCFRNNLLFQETSYQTSQIIGNNLLKHMRREGEVCQPNNKSCIACSDYENAHKHQDSEMQVQLKTRNIYGFKNIQTCLNDDRLGEDQSILENGDPKFQVNSVQARLLKYHNCQDHVSQSDECQIRQQRDCSTETPIINFKDSSTQNWQTQQHEASQCNEMQTLSREEGARNYVSIRECSCQTYSFSPQQKHYDTKSRKDISRFNKIQKLRDSFSEDYQKYVSLINCKSPDYLRTDHEMYLKNDSSQHNKQAQQKIFSSRVYRQSRSQKQHVKGRRCQGFQMYDHQQCLNDLNVYVGEVKCQTHGFNFNEASDISKSKLYRIQTEQSKEVLPCAVEQIQATNSFMCSSSCESERSFLCSCCLTSPNIQTSNRFPKHKLISTDKRPYKCCSSNYVDERRKNCHLNYDCGTSHKKKPCEKLITVNAGSSKFRKCLEENLMINLRRTKSDVQNIEDNTPTRTYSNQYIPEMHDTYSNYKIHDNCKKHHHQDQDHSITYSCKCKSVGGINCNSQHLAIDQLFPHETFKRNTNGQNILAKVKLNHLFFKNPVLSGSLSYQEMKFKALDKNLEKFLPVNTQQKKSLTGICENILSFGTHILNEKIGVLNSKLRQDDDVIDEESPTLGIKCNVINTENTKTEIFRVIENAVRVEYENTALDDPQKSISGVSSLEEDAVEDTDSAHGLAAIFLRLLNKVFLENFENLENKIDNLIYMATSKEITENNLETKQSKKELTVLLDNDEDSSEKLLKADFQEPNNKKREQETHLSRKFKVTYVPNNSRTAITKTGLFATVPSRFRSSSRQRTQRRSSSNNMVNKTKKIKTASHNKKISENIQWEINTASCNKRGTTSTFTKNTDNIQKDNVLNTSNENREEASVLGNHLDTGKKLSSNIYEQKYETSEEVTAEFNKTKLSGTEYMKLSNRLSGNFHNKLLPLNELSIINNSSFVSSPERRDGLKNNVTESESKNCLEYKTESPNSALKSQALENGGSTSLTIPDGKYDDPQLMTEKI